MEIKRGKSRGGPPGATVRTGTIIPKITASNSTPPRTTIRQQLYTKCDQSKARDRYTEAGDLAIDNNACERALRGIAVGRGNGTFVGSESGGATAATLYSVVGSCRRLSLDPWAYLRDVFTRLPNLSADRLDELLPDRWARERAAPTT